MPALKLAEIIIVVVGLVAFYVWQMRSLKRDRAETARQMAQAQHAGNQQLTAQDVSTQNINTQEVQDSDVRAGSDQASQRREPSNVSASPDAQPSQDLPRPAAADHPRPA